METCTDDQIAASISSLVNDLRQLQVACSTTEKLPLSDDNIEFSGHSSLLSIRSHKFTDFTHKLPLRIFAVVICVWSQWTCVVPVHWLLMRYDDISDFGSVKSSGSAFAPRCSANEQGLLHGRVAQQPEFEISINTKSRKPYMKPPRNKSAYMFFCADKRADARTAHPGASIVEISKILNDQWMSLTDSDKQVCCEFEKLSQ